MKNIVISGAGEVGRYSAEVLANRGHSITVVDSNLAALSKIDNIIEAKLVHGSSCHAEVLEEAGVNGCDVLIAATSLDEINFMTASIGQKLGAKKVIARAHERNFVHSKLVDYNELFNIDHLICPEELTSEAICNQMRNPGVRAVKKFAKNEIELHQFFVQERTPAIHKPLDELSFPPGVRLVTLKRDNESIIPGAKTVISPGDQITLVVPAQAIDDVNRLFQNQKIEHHDIAIVGASPVSEWILNDIDRRSFSVRLFEPNLEIAEKIANQYPWITVLNADPIETHVFESERLDEASAFIASGCNEEHNIMGSLQAKSLGAKTTFAVIHNSTYLNSLEGIGIDHPYSPRIEGAKEVLRLIDDSPIKILSELEQGEVVVYELTVAKDSKGDGKSLIDIDFSRATIIAAIQRGPKVIAPSPTDLILANDTLVIIGPRKIEHTLKTWFL